MSDNETRLFDACVDTRLKALRQATESASGDLAFIDRVMARVYEEPQFLGLSPDKTRRGLWICSALVAISLGWALQTEEATTSALHAASVPGEGTW